MTTCTHPPARAYAWWSYDPAQEADILCHGCSACGAVLSGGVDGHGNPVGQQTLMPGQAKPKKRKSKKLEPIP